jgi:hypothetical protein
MYRLSNHYAYFAKRTQFNKAEFALSLYATERYANSTFLSKAKNKPNFTCPDGVYRETQFISAKRSEDGSNPNLYRLGNLGNSGSPIRVKDLSDEIMAKGFIKKGLIISPGDGIIKP